MKEMEHKLKHLLECIQEGSISVAEGLENLKDLPFKDLDFAKIDTHREIRQKFPEIIYCPGKTLEQIKKIAAYLAQNTKNIIASRADEEVYHVLKETLPDTQYYPQARMAVLHRDPVKPSKGLILVISGGTADIPVAEEAALTAEIMGNTVERLYDVGVAGLHRLLAHLDLLKKANVLIVVAGMEGALASVVGGMVARPVIAVPTSIGYGANFHGLSALLSMLNSCAAGVGVVNIDNGLGAGRLAAMINEDRGD